MYVATNRQKKNAFAKRADLQRKAEEKPKAAPRATPTPVAEPKPDLEALKTAAALAAALIHADAPDELETSDEIQGGSGTDLEPEAEAEAEAEPEPKRGRPMSAAVAKRNATILQLLAENPEGLSRAALATELQAKEANVYSSLRKLQSDGKVRMENIEGTKYLWYLV